MRYNNNNLFFQLQDIESVEGSLQVQFNDSHIFV